MADFIIHCPKCNHAFEPGDSIREEVQNELRGQMKEWQKQKEIETAALIEAEKKKMHAELENNIKKNIASEYEAQLQQFQKNAADAEIKLNAARAKEVAFLQKEQDLKTKEAELEVTLQRQLIEERGKLQEQLAKEEAEKNNLKEQQFAMRTKELEKQIEDQKKLVEEMRRKQEQGSMQLQGEVQELMLEELLQTTFPFDKIEEVGKGVRGADCIQTVRNQFGSESGKIIYESKRTKDFANDWIEKLKSDMRTLGADVAIIVTQTLPKDMDRFGEKDGVYICTFTEVRSVALLLRNALLKIAEAKKSQENKGDKMVMLYDYLTSSEFSEQWKAIREGFMSMKLSIQKERDMMEKLWKSREKQLEKVLLNAAHIKGSVEGIAGADAVNLSITSSDDDALLLE
ncbi:MAG: DUF2130 domain-containing protein [Sediminibacterium sp.]